jgi:hypothetical protein
MVHTVSGHMAKFMISYYRNIEARQIGQDMYNFVISILMKQQQNGLKTMQNKSVWSR